MKAEDVPAELLELACDAMFGTPPPSPGDDWPTVRRALAAVLPAYREQIARQAVGLVVHGPGGVGTHCETCHRAMIASSDDIDAGFAVSLILGHATSPEHAARAGGGR